MHGMTCALIYQRLPVQIQQKCPFILLSFLRKSQKVSSRAPGLYIPCIYSYIIGYE